VFPLIPEIYLGPPGTGKTTRLIRIVQGLLEQGIPPDRIGYITFTRRGAQEAIDRTSAALGLDRRDLRYFRTIHSLAMRWLGLPSGSVMEGDRMQEFAEHIGERITGRLSQDDGTWAGYDRGDRMLFMDNLARIRRQPLRELYEHDHDDLDWRTVERFSRGLREFKQAREIYDYSDLLEQFVLRDTRPQLDALLVDEAQDLSVLQWDVVRSLARTARRLIVAGDDDQGIFAWAGGSLETLVEMQGQVTVLDQSYRVPVAVQSVAQDIVSRIRYRRPKVWNPRPAPGLVSRVSSIEQVDWTGPDVMLLARNRFQLEPIMAELRSAGVLFDFQGHSSAPRKILDAIVTWERLRRGEPQPARSVEAVYAQMTMNVGWSRGHKLLPKFADEDMATIASLQERGGLLTTEPWHIALDRVNQQDRAYIIRCRRNGELLTKVPRVRLSTIHGAKGGEADRVILMSDVARRVVEGMHRDPEDEARVWYVAATRAKEELTIVRPRTSQFYTL
jgi:DNA helicase-2/ATP-dependent DNA helicase PcrA